jgi:hypothetical protein
VFEQNGAAVSAAPIVTHTEQVVKNRRSQTVYALMSSFWLVWKIYQSLLVLQTEKDLKRRIVANS